MYEEKFKHKYEDVLMQTFGFNEADLEANQVFDMSPRQLARYHKLSRQITRFVSGFCLYFIICILLLIWNWPSLPTDELQAQQMTPLILFGLVCGVAIILFGLGFRFVVQGIIRQQSVQVVEDRIRLFVDTADLLHGVYSLKAGNKRFSLTKGQFLALKNGEPYRIYYIPFPKKILSMEWLR